MKTYFISLKLPKSFGEEQVQSLADLFEEHEDVLATVTQKENEAVSRRDEESAPWIIKWIVQSLPDLDHWAGVIQTHIEQTPLPDGITVTCEDLRTEPVPAVNWLQQSLDQFQPFEIPPFYIYGSHAEEERQKQLEDGEKNLIPIQINASIAFGTGQHPTTRGCLEALGALSQKGVDPRNVLDMGTGSGILAIAAAKLWPHATILAVDNDPDSISVTRDHIRMNRVKKIDTFVGDGFDQNILDPDRRFDLIIANILARPLKEMAEDLENSLAPGGHVVLSGVLDTQANDVARCYEAAGLSLDTRKDIKGWSTLVLNRQAQ